MQPGSARERGHLRVPCRVDLVRLPHVALPLHRPPPPEPPVRLPGPGPPRRRAAGHRLPWGRPHERAPPKRVLDPHAAAALRRRDAGGGVAVPLPPHPEPPQGGAEVAARPALRRPAVPGAVGPRPGRDGLLRGRRPEGLCERRVAEAPAAGLPAAPAAGSEELLPAEGRGARTGAAQHLVRRDGPRPGPHPRAGLLRAGAPVAAARRRHPVRRRLLRDRVPQAVLPRHTALRDPRDDPEDQGAAGHERHAGPAGPVRAGQPAAGAGHGGQVPAAEEQCRRPAEAAEREQ